MISIVLYVQFVVHIMYYISDKYQPLFYNVVSGRNFFSVLVFAQQVLCSYGQSLKINKKNASE